MSRGPDGGERASYDPTDRAQIHAVTKRGEWYQVEGHSGGRKVRLEIHAKDIESRSDKDARALMRRSLLGTATQERERA